MLNFIVRYADFLMFDFCLLSQASSLARSGKYVPGSIPPFKAEQSLFVADHKY